ncbi:ABC transporter ATP-binding protein [Nesterenkonia flava]|uniref:ABC transporter ATP-binding protein n=1 Tax=Nesterenkonia flava TaxID=469799 RepID=A0ABU1FV53_9MICC|nr:ABC transporter ATP-binding protein [Nesterenkonia flava]MDR5712147.1 ABC transporter ATP-binding protein [Nesterenkonia flava]
MNNTKERLLEVEQLDVHLGSLRSRRQIITNASFSLRLGESVGLIGESGSGKSTIARTLLGLVKPSHGQITFDGQRLSGFSVKEWNIFRRKGSLQYVFQDPLRSLDPELTLGRSLAEPLHIQGRFSRKEIRRKTEELAIDVNLAPELLDRYPAELSGGQRQRVAVARGLILEPKLLILDEPVSALDSANRVQVLQLLEKLRQRGISLLFISHDLGSVAGMTDRTLVLYRGDLVEQGTTREVINSPQHPYTKLLIGSAPTLAAVALDRKERDALRQELAAF